MVANTYIYTYLHANDDHYNIFGPVKHVPGTFHGHTPNYDQFFPIMKSYQNDFLLIHKPIKLLNNCTYDFSANSYARDSAATTTHRNGVEIYIEN